MISTGYIHAQDDLWFFESNYHESMTFIDGVLGELAIRGMQGDTMRTLGVYTESQDEYYAESAADAVRKLGEKVIEIINRIKEFISSIIGKIRGMGIKHKALGKDFAKIEKSNPELAEKIKVSVASGDIDFATMRGISDYYKEVDKIMEDIKKNKIDPKSLRGRLEAAKKKLNEKKETIQTIAAVLGLVASATGIYWGYRKYQASRKQQETNFEQIEKEYENAIRKAETAKSYLEKLPEKDQPATRIGYIAKVLAEVEKTSNIELTKRMRFMEKYGTKFDNACKAVLNKLGKTSSYSAKKNAALGAELERLRAGQSENLRKMNRAAEAIEKGTTTASKAAQRSADLAKTIADTKNSETKAKLNESMLKTEDEKRIQNEELHIIKKANLEKEGERTVKQTRAAESQIHKNASAAFQNAKTQESIQSANKAKEWASYQQGDASDAQKTYWENKDAREANRHK